MRPILYPVEVVAPGTLLVVANSVARHSNHCRTATGAINRGSNPGWKPNRMVFIRLCIPRASEAKPVAFRFEFSPAQVEKTRGSTALSDPS
jgi:hypothetical protein